MNFKNLYLDIDGMILTSKNSKPSENVIEFLNYITINFNCFWLTTHCKGETQSTLNYLSNFFDSETIEILKKIKPTNWKTLKTEGIDFSSEFIWLDDYPFNAEKEVLNLNSCAENLIEINLNRNNELLNVIEQLRKGNGKAIIVSITKFIDSSQPGWIECEFTDAWGNKHIFQEKVPIVTSNYLDENDIYPQKGVIMCEILRIWRDENHRKIISVSTENHIDIESIDGLFEFDILEQQIINIEQ